MRRFWIALAILAAALTAALVDREAGLGRWWRLAGDLEQAQGRIAELEQEIGHLEAESAALRDDPFAQERAIRADLELARPGETIVRWVPAGEGQTRRP